jgi:hypothetical protein
MEKPLARHAKLKHQKMMPRGKEMRSSSAVGAEERWNETKIAEETMARYIARRSQERNVRSLARWSRASDAVFSRSRGPRIGRARNRGPEDAVCLFKDQKDYNP